MESTENWAGVFNIVWFDWENNNQIQIFRLEDAACVETRHKSEQESLDFSFRLAAGPQELGAGWIGLNKSPLNTEALLPHAGWTNQQTPDVRESSTSQILQMSSRHINTGLWCHRCPPSDIPALMFDSFLTYSKLRSGEREFKRCSLRYFIFCLLSPNPLKSTEPNKMSVLLGFPTLSVAFRPKSIGFYLRHKSLKMAHKYIVSFFTKPQ